VVLLNLALALGVGWGYLWWGRQAVRLQRELVAARSTLPTVEREWTVSGVVRAVLPDIDVVVLTHEEIPGYMAPMTMGFRASSPQIYAGVRIGDAVRFTVRGTPPNVRVVKIERMNGGGSAQ
jgi:Cu/Ag efflux protein CusF